LSKYRGLQQLIVKHITLLLFRFNVMLGKMLVGSAIVLNKNFKGKC